MVRHVSLRNFRSYHLLELDLAPGLVLVTGPNGAGKTNLLEALHVGSQGFSLRTRTEARLVRSGEAAARVALVGEEDGAPFATQVDIVHGGGKRVALNGNALASVEDLRPRLSTLVFTPARLAVVKGGPLVRRAYLDRMLGRLFPARAALPPEYGRVLAQRNAALRHIRTGASSIAALEPWTRRLADLGAALDSARAELVALLSPGFRDNAALLGLDDARLRYEASGLTVEELEARLARDVERGTTGTGPHLRDAQVVGGGRDLRAYGSQGEQRAAVLALILAEASLLAERRGARPLLLLDDVLSELDESRRLALLAELPADAQTLVTAADRGAYPRRAPAPTLVISVTPGHALAE